MRIARFFFAMTGRIPRGSYVAGSLSVLLLFTGGYVLLEQYVGLQSTWALYPFTYASLMALSIKRSHDMGKSGTYLLWVVIPLVGLMWLFATLVFRRGTDAENEFGPEPVYHGLVHHVVATNTPNVVNDVTGLNPVEVAAIVAPTTIGELCEALKRSSGPVSVGGGRFSMGGQTASTGSLHIDMRKLNRVLTLSPVERTIRVQAGIRWCDIQRFIDSHDLSVKIMQTYANFTVGGSLSVNCHGRYVGMGPLILSVRAIMLVLADGSVVEASREQNANLFFGAIGGYGGIGVVAEVELDLDDNSRLERVTEMVRSKDYLEHFRQKVRSSPAAVFHNGDLYPPHYDTLRSVTWEKTERFVTNPHRVMRVEPSHRLFRYIFWTVSSLPFGGWRRRWLYEPLFYAGGNPVHWRNFEAGYDVAELEPKSRRESTFVLQEYFVPIEQYDRFVEKMGEVFRRFSVNVVNVSVRHANADSGSMLAWAREECFAFVVYYKQNTDDAAKSEVGVWTRALIDAAIECEGAYYLPYQAHASADQFHRAYPRAKELFVLKAEVDPDYRFRNVIWETYYGPLVESDGGAEGDARSASKPESEFHSVFGNPAARDAFFLFLQNVYRIFPEGQFHWLIREACGMHTDDEAIYRQIQERLPDIAPALAPVRFGVPALAKQKKEMARQTMSLLNDNDITKIDGYLEIGSTGRYVSTLRKHIRVRGPLYLINDIAPTHSPVDMVERGQVSKLGRFYPLGDYEGFDASQIPDESLDLVTCYIGLHHAPRENLDAFVTSIRRVLRPGGMFVLRDHDADSDAMKTFVSLVHTVFNAGLFAPWSTDESELRFFTGADEIASYLGERGFEDTGARLFQEHDPSDNALMAFIKGDA